MKQHRHRPARSLKTKRSVLPRVFGTILVVCGLSSLVIAGSGPRPFLSAGMIARPVANKLPAHPRAMASPVAGAYQPFHPGYLPLLGGTWTAEGPAPTQMAQSRIPPNNPVVGAIKGVAAHPTNANTIYVNTVNGGIWETTDGGANWAHQTDSADSLSGGPIKFDPLDGNLTTLIAGIGRFSSDGFLGGRRAGLLVTSDGTNWGPPPGNATIANLNTNVNGVAARGMILMAATDAGFWRSDDGGVTFTLLSSAPANSGLPFGGRFLDLAENPSTKAIPDGVVMVSDGFGCVEEWSNNGTFLKTGAGQDAGSTSARDRRCRIL